MSADQRLITQIQQSIWRPHWLAPVGTALALMGLVCGVTVLAAFRPELETWLKQLTLGGLAGGSNTPDRINGLRIVTGFCGMMLVVGGVTLWRARGHRQRLMATLAGAPGVVWIYREQAKLRDSVEHVLVFGLDSGVKLRATLPTSEADALWLLAVDAFPAASRGHDSQQERRFATRPELALSKPRIVDGVQMLEGRDRAR